MGKEEILELTVRREIYNHILQSPGLHERELSRKLNIPLSTLNYHLKYLKKRNLLSSSLDGLYTRYYVVGEIGSEDRKVIGVLRQKVPRKIVLFLLLNSRCNHRDIYNHVGVAPSTASFHLNKLAEFDVITRMQTGRETVYHIKNPEHISDLLITYKKSFFDSAVDSFVDTWFELHPRNLKKPEKNEE